MIDDDVYGLAIRCLAAIAGLTQQDRDRVLRHAMKMNRLVKINDPTNLGEGEAWQGYCEFCGDNSVACVVCGRPAVANES